LRQSGRKRIRVEKERRNGRKEGKGQKRSVLKNKTFEKSEILSVEPCSQPAQFQNIDAALDSVGLITDSNVTLKL